ncbi:MAG: hypothetical protein AMXMBFR64_05810 [Myxococcales bacterium]
MMRISSAAALLAVGLSAACGTDEVTPGEVGFGKDTTGDQDFISFPMDTGSGVVDTGSGVDDVWTPSGDGDGSGMDGLADEDTGPAPGEFGYPCTGNNQCLSGFCVFSEKGQVCTQECVEECPGGWSCIPVQSTGTDLTYVCLSRFQNLCRPCGADSDCNEDFELGVNACIDFGGDGSFCGVACQGNEDCRDGYSCQDVKLESGAVTKQCVPSSGECECAPLFVQQQAKTTCFHENTFGHCDGQRVCGPDGLTACSAGVPAKEVCNGKDDNCDGKIDPPGASGCIDWFLDIDGDGYGIGVPKCECESPGPGYVDKGGDCNDSNTGVSPKAEEACNGIDDNCDGKIDEDGSIGCSTYATDKDGDGFGSNTETVCLCTFGPGVSLTKGDCDDNDANVKPGVPDECDGVDNNCDGQVDEENAGECVPYYLDQDGDGYGLADKVKCLCGPQDQYTTQDAGDCNDNDSKIAPFKPEICDGKDNDCDGETDEGNALEMCGTVKNGAAACVAGACVVGKCDGGYYDIDFDIQTGCECKANIVENSGPTCEKAVDLGTLTDKGITLAPNVQGNAVYSDESDWYVFKGTDGPDAAGCDSYHVRVRFLNNPLNAYTFDVYRGSCAAANQLCKQGSDFQWFTDFLEGDKGECKCAGIDQTAEDVHVCTDNTSLYFVRVYRHPDVPPSCDGYTIEITNGVY